MEPLNSSTSDTAESTNPITPSSLVIPSNSQNNNSNIIKTILTILGLIFLFPVGIILMWVLTHWPKWLKWLITLILPVIIILAILAVVGLTVFSGSQKEARDARRKSDIQSISNALESHYGSESPKLYPAVKASWFANNQIPQDPTGTNYIGLPQSSTATFNICANLDNNSPKQYCKQNVQGM